MGEALPIIYHFYFLRIINKKKILQNVRHASCFMPRAVRKGTVMSY